ncbi:PREDICTED: E3 ubiquitin-protein ligase RNF31-like [Amphimedon queenslandica]|nr:PREDICTED: E3 ubiquitin-protein ligase RNF31-like [Amphimedon queenslandica]|eukprot:XP_019851921.1 PREDICTED: E3 ubiquitin-protein ligase RNF31-like [Amphimedon queenslandica]
MMERMSEVTTGINVEELHLKEKADFILRKHIKSLHHIGDIVASTALQKFRVKKINCIEHVGKTVSFSLSIEAPDLSLLSVPLSFLRCSLVPVAKDDQPSHTTVTTTSTDPGVYRVQCNLSTTGTHSYIVKIQIYGVQLEDIIYVDNTSVHIVTYPWVVAFEDWHDGILCHQFAQWKAGDDRVGAEAELIAMTAKNGIECPMCKLHFELAKRDCNNWRMSCIRCPTEFCFGCKRMYFKSGYECDRQYCKTGASRPLPQHAHHPRDCLFYLRDYDVVSLKKLLDDNNVKYLSKPSEAQVAATKDKRVQGEPIDKPDGEEWDIPKPPAHVIDGEEILLVCPVILLKETPSGFGDEPCRKHAPFGMAGLCEWHYKEYLVHKINEAKLDPVEIYNLHIMKLIIKREGIEVPEEYDDEDEEHYKGRLVEIVKEKIPID